MMDGEPIVPNPNAAPETAPKPEQAPVGAGEKLPSSSPERAAPSPERQAQGQGMSLPTVQPPAVPLATPVPTGKTASDDGDGPAIADDVDVIEMEWVNQAKKVIKETKDDPHAQEQAVEKLQRDYLKKRYGRDLKVSSN